MFLRYNRCKREAQEALCAAEQERRARTSARWVHHEGLRSVRAAAPSFAGPVAPGQSAGSGNPSPRSALRPRVAGARPGAAHPPRALSAYLRNTVLT